MNVSLNFFVYTAAAYYIANETFLYRVLYNLAKFLDMLNVSENSSETQYGFDTYALQVQDIDPDSFTGKTFMVILGAVKDAIRAKGNFGGSLVTFEMVTNILENSTASVQLPDDFLDLAQGCTSDSSPFGLRLSFSVFLSDVLFQSQQNRSEIGSIIVATRLCAASNSSPIRVTFRTIEQV